MKNSLRFYGNRFRIGALGAIFALLPAPAHAQGHTPDDAVERMTVAPGLTAELVAAEPLVRQPVAIHFDHRGRLWVLQYLQYPNPAGLTRVEIDQYTRTRYDRVPEPPPHGPKGADRLTILTDTDGDGRADHSHDFLSDLNIAAGFALGHGGVYVLQAPYLLFYPDRDRDDRPDGDPEVLLTGFGLDDASAVANSLTFGPDGWLYGCQGSTVTAHIRDTTFVQAIWRYHPLTHHFELFAEGGGNMWGLDFDRHGTLFASTNHGGYVLLHMVQGGYYWKQFGKHGPLRNPYTFGYFDHAPHENFQGGHVTVGGTIYQGHTLPAHLHGKFIAGDTLGHAVRYHHLHPTGTTFRTENGGPLVEANDTWCAPTDLTTGPDGALYFTDWHDVRTAHPNPDAPWDRTNGRIYRLRATDAPTPHSFDIHQLSEEKLLELHIHPNQWHVRAARRELAARASATPTDENKPAIQQLAATLRKNIADLDDHQLALEYLWTLASIRAFPPKSDQLSDEDLAFIDTLLAHPDPYLRAWTVRLLGDDFNVEYRPHANFPDPLADRLVHLARTETHPHVRSQLASTAARLPAEPALAIAAVLVAPDSNAPNRDIDDPYIPLLIWWAIEPHTIADLPGIEERFITADAWDRPLLAREILPRLARRLAADAGRNTLHAYQKLLDSAPTPEQERILLAELDAGLDLAPAAVTPPPGLATRIEQLWRADRDDDHLLRINARFGNPDVIDYARRAATDSNRDTERRLRMLAILQRFGTEEQIPLIIPLIQHDNPPKVRSAALDVLARYTGVLLGDAILANYRTFDDATRARARSILFAHKPWALEFLDSIEPSAEPIEINTPGRFIPPAIEIDEIARSELTALAAHRDPQIDALVEKHWGSLNSAGSQQKITEIRRVRFDLKHPGDPAVGQKLFTTHCATCHQLFGTGKQLGPDLTTANRHDLDYLLESIIDPSAFVRKEYRASVVVTLQGRVLTGIITAQTPTTLTIANEKNETTTLRREDVDEIQPATASLMPENILRPLAGQDLRDLFAYLQADPPPATQ